MFKELGNLASLVRQAQQMGGKVKEIADQLRAKRVSGNAGGGMVAVEANGLGEVLTVKVDPTLKDLEMIEDLLPAAINQALGKAKELHVQMMQEATGDLNIPGLQDALSQFTSGQQ